MENVTVANPVNLTEFKNNIMGDPTSVAGNPTVAYLSCVDLDDGNHEKVLRWNAPANTISPTYGIGAWAKLYFPSGTTYTDEVWLSFDARFNSGHFQTDEADCGGGKFMGVGGKNGNISSPPSGGAPTPYGCSCRFEFLSDALGGALTTNDEAVTYTYDAVQTEQFGIVRGMTSPGPRQRWGPTGTWKHMEMHLVMNTVSSPGTGVADGVLEVSVDGTLRQQITNMTWRVYNDVHWTHVAWSMFFGGGDSSWASTSPSSVDLDNLIVEGVPQ